MRRQNKLEKVPERTARRASPSPMLWSLWLKWAKVWCWAHSEGTPKPTPVPAAILIRYIWLGCSSLSVN